MISVPTQATIIDYTWANGQRLRFAEPKYLDGATCYMLAGYHAQYPVFLPQKDHAGSLYDPIILVRPQTAFLEIRMQAYRKAAAGSLVITPYRWDADSGVFAEDWVTEGEFSGDVFPFPNATLTHKDLGTIPWAGTGDVADGAKGMVQLDPSNAWEIYKLALTATNVAVRTMRIVQRPTFAVY